MRVINWKIIQKNMRLKTLTVNTVEHLSLTVEIKKAQDICQDLAHNQKRPYA